MNIYTATEVVNLMHESGASLGGQAKGRSEFGAQYLKSVREMRAVMLREATIRLAGADLVVASQYARDVTGIDFTPDQMAGILELYPAQRAMLALNTLQDASTREVFMNVVSHFLAGSRWPSYEDHVDRADFVGLLERQASRLGYQLTPPSGS